LNIPSVAANQAYYTPGQTAPTSNTLNTNQRAPTPVNQSQVGWRAADPNLSSGNSTQQNDSRSVLTNQTKFVETTPPANRNMNPGNQPPTRTAALPGSGVSFTSSRDYQSTRFDERQDSTRLAGTDATMVRAPSRTNPTGANPQFQQPFRNQANYSVPTQQTYAQNGFYQPQTGYTGQLMAYNGQQVAYQGQAQLVNPGIYTQNNAVLAQSTTNAGSSSGAASQVGWRSRELNSNRINR
jgi:hypothetical protein